VVRCFHAKNKGKRANFSQDWGDGEGEGIMEEGNEGKRFNEDGKRVDLRV
jgi:hypothetical protein